MKENTCTHDFDMESASCTYGCGTKIEVEHGGYCPVCKDHASNQVECRKCGALADLNDDGTIDTKSIY